MKTLSQQFFGAGAYNIVEKQAEAIEMKKFTNGKFTVLANGCLAEPFEIEIRTCHEDDCYFVKFSGFEPMIMTEDEIESEFTFVNQLQK